MVTTTRKQSTAGKQQGSGVKVGKLSLRKERVKSLSAAEKKQVKGGLKTTTGGGDPWTCINILSCYTK